MQVAAESGISARLVVDIDTNLVDSARNRLLVLKGVQPAAWATKPLRATVSIHTSHE
jgi:hypothetical protein